MVERGRGLMTAAKGSRTKEETRVGPISVPKARGGDAHTIYTWEGQRGDEEEGDEEGGQKGGGRRKGAGKGNTQGSRGGEGAADVGKQSRGRGVDPAGLWPKRGSGQEAAPPEGGGGE